MKKKIQPEVPITEMTLLSKTKCNICIAWNCEVPKNCPKWLLDQWNEARKIEDKLWFETEISFTEILEIFNLGIDVMLSRIKETGAITVSLNKMGWRFGQR